MADGTAIEWTDATWNPVTGCALKSPGCIRCYAMRLAGTRMKNHWSRAGLTQDTKNGPVWNGEVRFNEEWIGLPLRWSKPRLIFVCAHADLFYEAVPDGWIMRVLDVMARSPRHAFQVLTKRPDRMLEFFRRWSDVNVEQDLDFKNARGPAAVRAAHPSGRGQLFAAMLDAMGEPPPGCSYPPFDWAGGMSRWPDIFGNIWLGVSVEDQARADERREPLRALAALGWNTWVSYEPALGPVDWTGWEFVRALVSGGESDVVPAMARPSRADWHRAARDWCAANGVAYDFKQWGCWIEADQIADRIASAAEAATAWIEKDGAVWNPPRPLNFTDAAWLAEFLGRPDYEHQSDGATLFNMKKADAGRLLDGRAHDGFPALLRQGAAS